MISTLKKKRDSFRIQIRRSSLQKLFDKKRKALLQLHISIDIKNKMDEIFNDIQVILLSLTNKLQQTTTQQQQARSEQISKKFQKLKSLAPQMHPLQYDLAFTNYMIAKDTSNQVIKLLENLILNRVEDVKQQDQNKYNVRLRNTTLYQIINFLDEVIYGCLSLENLTSVINRLWDIFKEQILYNPVNGYVYMRKSLTIVKKCMQSNSYEEIFNLVKSKGIQNIIIQFIQNIDKFQGFIQCHGCLLEFIKAYIDCQLDFDQIVGEQNRNYFQTIIQFTKQSIDKNQCLYPTIFHILSKSYHLIEQDLKLEDKIIQKILKMMLNQDKRCQVQSLEILNTITCFQSNKFKLRLITQYHIFDLLMQRLKLQQLNQNDCVVKNVQNISEILCGCIESIQDKKQYQDIFNHQIWFYIVQNLQPSNKIIHMVKKIGTIFLLGNYKSIKQLLKLYLQALRDIESFSYYKADIQNNIREIFMAAVFNSKWRQNQTKEFVQVLNEMNLLDLIQDMIDPDILEELIGKQNC